jgi:hypothetical protein
MTWHLLSSDPEETENVSLLPFFPHKQNNNSLRFPSLLHQHRLSSELYTTRIGKFLYRTNNFIRLPVLQLTKKNYSQNYFPSQSEHFSRELFTIRTNVFFFLLFIANSSQRYPNPILVCLCSRPP